MKLNIKCIFFFFFRPINAGGIFSLVVTLLTKSHISLDLECHQWLLKLASNIFTGLYCNIKRKFVMKL